MDTITDVSKSIGRDRIDHAYIISTSRVVTVEYSWLPLFSPPKDLDNFESPSSISVKVYRNGVCKEEWSGSIGAVLHLRTKKVWHYVFPNKDEWRATKTVVTSNSINPPDIILTIRERSGNKGRYLGARYSTPYTYLFLDEWGKVVKYAEFWYKKEVVENKEYKKKNEGN